ncbi:MAG: bifunctional diaminohydroxyphosphoribosylaminopyrimidine deaminase/5-amino-6-(5-phosphoribosylamino)uracil reductase RibD [Desulfobacterales bacterium]
MDDNHYMALALELAERGRGFTSPNPMVGAVVVNRGKVVGRGYHEAVGQAHGEVNAIEDAGDDAQGSCLYVTLEPCNHTGRTGPCTEKILASGVRRVVIAMADPNPDVTGNGAAALQARGIDVTMGVGETRAKRLNEAYIKYVRTRRPFVTIKCAATLDGRIATRTGDSKWISGESSRRYVHQLRHSVDAILVGKGTLHKDDPSLTTRLGDRDQPGLDPIRIILDEDLSISEKAKVLRLDSDSDTVLVTGSGVSEDKKKRVEKAGVRVLEIPLKDRWIDLDLLLDHLGKIAITSLLIEGGSHVFASALSAGLVDKVIFFYAPKILGGDDGVPIFRGQGPASMADSLAVKDIRVQRFDDDIMIEGYL